MFEEYPEIITPKELGKMLRIGMNQVYDILNDGEIPAYRAGRNWKIYKGSVITYISERS